MQPHRQLRCSARLKLARRSVGGFLLTYTGGLVAVKSNLVSFETGRRLLVERSTCFGTWSRCILDQWGAQPAFVDCPVLDVAPELAKRFPTTTLSR